MLIKTNNQGSIQKILLGGGGGDLDFYYQVLAKSGVPPYVFWNAMNFFKPLYHLYRSIYVFHGLILVF